MKLRESGLVVVKGKDGWLIERRLNGFTIVFDEIHLTEHCAMRAAEQF